MSIQDSPNRVISHKALRLGTGLIAFLMPILVVWLSGQGRLPSISDSYWSDSRDIFVGSLTAIAFFMMAYNGTSVCRRDTEYWLSKLAGLCALLVALFPTSCDTPGCTQPPKWIVSIASSYVGNVHYAAAIILFVCLILMVSFFSLRAKNKGQHTRSWFYFSISLGMLVGMPLVYLICEINGSDRTIYWVEIVGLFLFALGWLRAGWYKTEKDAYLPAGAVEVGKFEVDPGNTDFPTEIELTAGDEYFFTANGCWTDSWLGCGAYGWGPNWNPLTYWNRIKWRPFFLLCGNVGKSWNDSHLTFSIGGENSWIVPEQVNDLNPEERKLYLFANDWKNKYKNNKPATPCNGGPMVVTIYKVEKGAE